MKPNTVGSVYQRMRDHYRTIKSKKPTLFTKVKWPVYGKMTIRVLPKPDGQQFHYFVGARHFNLGNSKWPEWCPSVCTSHFDEPRPCPVDEFAAELSRSTDSDDKALAKSLKPTPRYYWSVVVKKIINEDGSKEVPEQIPVILEVPESVWAEMVGFFYLNSDVNLDSPGGDVDDDEILDFTDAYSGRDIILVKRRGKGNRVEYQVSLASTSTPLGTDDEIEQILAARENLDEYIPNQCKSYEQLKAIMLGESATATPEVSEPEDDEDEEKAPVHTPPSRSKPSFDEDDDEDAPFDVDEPEDSEDTEVEEKPTPKPKPTSSPSSALSDLVRKQMSKRGAK